MGERVSQIAKVPEVKQSSSNSQVRKTERLQSMDTPVDRILFLQRNAGNQAVQRLIKSGALQAKLRIGQPGDVYEQEADRVADAVMRTPEPGVQRQVEPEEEEEETLQPKPLASQITPLVQQRQEEREEEEEMLQAKPLPGQITPLVQRQIEPEEEEEEEMLQAKGREDATSEVTNDLESQINAIKDGGQPLPESSRTYFEPRFGGDFSHVRVHTDARAAESARAVNARAFTVGQDVVFGAGQYAPESSTGQSLMAHELTHVVQQNKALLKSDSNLQLKPDVRGMVTEARQEGRTPRQREWTIIESALDAASSMVDQTIDRMERIHNLLLPGSDPRFYSESQIATANLFRRHFKSRSAIEALEVREYYQFILDALDSLQRNSFRIVPADVAQSESDGDVYAYVYGRQPTIYLAGSFFGELQEVQTNVSVTVGPRILTPELKARILIHETAHFRLGVHHRGGTFGFDVVNCSRGLPVRTSSQAMENAYVYDHFAYCASH